uniref:Urease accessory protein UreF n=1 Tax=Amblyomma maculatum TaxID=34609 RepID=G3MSV8_AMBMU
MSSLDANSLLNLLQISDSAFPTGSFAHSGGLEAAYQRGFLSSSGAFSVPFMREAHRSWVDLEAIRSLDCVLNASLSNHVANRASTQQGRSLIQTACATYKDSKLTEVQNLIYDGKLFGHQVLMYGILCAFLGISEDQAAISFLFSSLRTMVAAGVRLGAVGTLEGQRMQFQLQLKIPEVMERHRDKCKKKHSLDRRFLR